MANEVRIRASVKDDASKPLKSIHDGWKRFQADGSKGIAIGAGAVATAKAFSLLDGAISGVVNVMGDAVQAAREDEESQSRLGAALKANIPNWNGNTKAIEDTIAARQLLGFTDEEQRKSLALLVVATNDVKKALDIQAAAMDLARLKGISLEAASEALIKVEGGQFRALKALGIQLPKNATATEALAAVQRAATGSAEAYADTSAGKLLTSQIKFGEAMEKLGYILLPVATDAMVMLSDAASGIATDFANAAREIGPFLDELAKLEQVKISNPGAELGAALHDLLWPVDITNTGLTQNVQESAKHLEQTIPEVFGPAFTGAWKQVDTKPAALAVTQSFGSDLAAQSSTARKYGDRLAGAVAKGLSDGIYNRRDEAALAWQSLLDGLDNQMTPGQEKGRLLGYLVSDELRKALASKDPALQAKARATRQLILDQLDDLIPYGAKIGKQGMELLRQGMKSKDPTIRAAAKSIYNAATQPLAGVPAKAGQYGKSAGNSFAAGLASTQHRVESAAAKLAGAVGSYLKVSSPAEKGPLSTLGGPEGWGERIGAFVSKGLSSTLPNLTGALGGMPPSGGGLALAGSGGGWSGGAIPVPVPMNWSPAQQQAWAREAAPVLARELQRQGII